MATRKTKIKFESKTVYMGQVCLHSKFIKEARERKIPIEVTYRVDGQVNTFLIPWEHIEKYGYENKQQFRDKYRAGERYTLWYFRIPSKVELEKRDHQLGLI